MKLRVAIPADRAARAVDAILAPRGRLLSISERREQMAELAAAVNGAVPCQLPSDPEASEDVTYRFDTSHKPT